MSFLALILFVVGIWSNLVLGQVLPFLVTGFLDGVTVNTGTAPNRGGSISVSGYTIKIPDNLLVEFPAVMVPFAEFAAGGTGARLPPNEVSINGNIVNNVIIAGQFTISQLSLAASSGIIERLDFDGSIKIQNGPTLRISDPNAKYTAGFTSLPFYTADDENPSISSFSGVPMCVPRSATDEKCPASNRPAGTAFNLPDATHMVPMKVGDYIEYSGVQSGGQTICNTIVVNVGISTSGTQPGFIRVEDAIIGIADANVDVEAARYRWVGYCSRADTPITIWAIDEDPCTGAESDRLLATTSVDAGAVRNKWEVRILKGTSIGLYTRNYRVRAGDNVVTTSDGIRAGQYVQPVTEWIFPELVTPGGTPPPMDFSNIGPLRNGFGPADAAGTTIFGQLNPWPGASAPVPSPAVCASPTPTPTGPTTPPTSTPVLVATAGVDQTVLSGVFVTLSASQTTADVPANELSFNWTQIAGPALTLTATTSPSLSFFPPVVSPGVSVSREFRITITHTPTGAKANDTVVVTANRAASSRDHAAFDTLTWESRQGGTAAATAHTDLVDPAGSMKIQFGAGAELAMARSVTVNGQALYVFAPTRSSARYTSATIRSYINNVFVPGSAVTSTTVTAP